MATKKKKVPVKAEKPKCYGYGNPTCEYFTNISFHGKANYVEVFCNKIGTLGHVDQWETKAPTECDLFLPMIKGINNEKK